MQTKPWGSRFRLFLGVRGRAPHGLVATAATLTAIAGSALLAPPGASATPIGRADLYVILDRSGSMLTEVSTLRSNLSTIVNQLACPPAGTGDANLCIQDLWAGAGAMGYQGSGVDAFRNVLDLQAQPNFSLVPTNEPAGCCLEPMTFAIHATITGGGGAAHNMSGVPARSTCDGSPAHIAGFAPFGYPCFRGDAITVVVLATDEVPLSAGDTYKLPDWNTVVRGEMLARGAHLVGLVGDGATAAVTTDLNKMATDTGAVDARNGNAPLVFGGGGSAASTALLNGIRTLIAGLPRPAPVTGTDGYTTAADTPLNVDAPGILVNDTGDRSHPLRAALATQPANGTATIESDGSLTYTPAAGFSGTDTFTYKAIDTVSNAESDATTVSVDVTAPPAPPPTDPPPTDPPPTDPPPATEPPATAPPATAPAPAPTTPAAPVERAVITVKPAVLGLPAARTCTSRRRVRFRLRAPRGERLVEARVFVGSKPAKVVKGRALASPVALRLPNGRVRVRVVATVASGKRFTSTRRYGRCVS